MAKKLGEDVTEKKPSKGAQAPEVAGNLTKETFLETVREMQDIENEGKAYREKRKRARKVFKARGVELGILDETVKMTDWSREEVRANVDNRLRYASWLGLPGIRTPDLFKGLSPEDVAAAEWEARGATDYLVGKSGQPPEDCPEENKLNYARGFKKAASTKPKGPRTDADGKIVAPPRDEEMEKDFETGGAADTAAKTGKEPKGAKPGADEADAHFQ